MKKMVIIIMAVMAVMVSMCSCGANDTYDGLEQLSDEEIVRLYKKVTDDVEVNDVKVLDCTDDGRIVAHVVEVDGKEYAVSISRETALREMSYIMSK